MEGRSGRLAVTSRSLWARALHSCRSCRGRWKRCHSSSPVALRSLVLFPFMLQGGERGQFRTEASTGTPREPSAHYPHGGLSPIHRLLGVATGPQRSPPLD